MTALVRYLAACCLNAQRWVAPGVVFVLSLAITFVNGGDPLTTVAEGATWLFPITAWVTVLTLNDEDPSQAAITAASAGGPGRAHAAKLIVAAAAGAAMAVLSVLLAWATTASAFTVDDLAAAVVSHLLAVAGGVALGSICARPVIARTGWAVLAIIALSAVDLAVPDAPPARIVLAALANTHPGQLWPALALAAAEVALLAVVLVGVSSLVSRRRS